MHPTTPIQGDWTEDLVADGFKRFRGEWTSAMGGVRFGLSGLRLVRLLTSCTRSDNRLRLFAPDLR